MENILKIYTKITQTLSKMTLLKYLRSNYLCCSFDGEYLKDLYTKSLKHHMFYYKQILLEANHMMLVRFVRIYEMSELNPEL